MSGEIEMKSPQLIFHITRIDVDATLELRQSVLWPTLSIADVRLAEDDQGLHFGAFIPHLEKPIAVISLFDRPLPEQGLVTPEIDSPTRRKSACFRKFACDPMHRNHGVGTKLLRYAIEAARLTLDASIVWCDARVTSSAWYKRRGMVEFGDPFYKRDVLYIRMKMSTDEDTWESNPCSTI